MSDKPPHIAQKDWDAVCDNPEWTADMLASARPFAEVFHVLAAKLKVANKQAGDS